MKPDRTQRPFYEPAAPVLHREGVDAVDAADPATAEGAVSSAGYQRIRFDLDTTACTALTALKVQALFWNPLAGRYFRGDARELSAADLAGNPVPALDVETRGAPAVFLKVAGATADALDVDVYATAW